MTALPGWIRGSPGLFGWAGMLGAGGLALWALAFWLTNAPAPEIRIQWRAGRTSAAWHSNGDFCW
jgi:hypothetical protein